MLAEQEKGALGQAVILAIPELIGKFDDRKSSQLIMSLLNFVKTKEQEQSKLYHAIMSIIPQLLQKNSSHSDFAVLLLKSLLETPMNLAQEHHQLGQLIVSSIPQFVESFNHDGLLSPWNFIELLLTHLPAIQQENSAFISKLLSTLTSLLERIDNNASDRLIKYLLEHPMTYAQEWS